MAPHLQAHLELRHNTICFTLPNALGVGERKIKSALDDFWGDSQEPYLLSEVDVF